MKYGAYTHLIALPILPMLNCQDSNLCLLCNVNTEAVDAFSQNWSGDNNW